MWPHYDGGCGFPVSAPAMSWRLGGLWRGAEPGGLVTSWKALPEDGLVRAEGDWRGGAMEVNPAAGGAWPSPPDRFDQRNRVAWECGPVLGEVRGERREPGGGEEDERTSRLGMS